MGVALTLARARRRREPTRVRDFMACDREFVIENRGLFVE
jgi:hypothetical protein